MALFSCLLLAISGCSAGQSKQDDASFKDAKALYDAGKFPQAETALTALLENSPDDVEALKTLALAQAAQGENKEAIAQYARLVKLDPKDHGSLYRMALLERVIGQPDKTVEHLQGALAASPGNRSYTDELARTEMSLGHYAQAAELWGGLIRGKGESEESAKELLVLQGQAYLAAKDYEKAESSYRRALKLDPDDKALKVTVKSFE